MNQHARIEYERRFLVDPAWRPPIDPTRKRIEDLYLRGTALRVRVQTELDSGRRRVKLTKKVQTGAPYAHELSTIALSYDEHALFEAMPGDRLVKVRYYVSMQVQPMRIAAVDVFEGELAGLVTCEIEAETTGALLSMRPPAFATSEVTNDAFFTGGVLCRAPRAELLARLGLA